MALQKTIDNKGVTYTNAYIRIVCTEDSNFIKLFRVDVYGSADAAQSENNRLFIYDNYRISISDFTTYKLDTAGVEEVGRSTRKGCYEWLKANDVFFTDATDI